MKKINRIDGRGLVAGVLLMSAGCWVPSGMAQSQGQQNAQLAAQASRHNANAYDVAREIVVTGKVAEYAAASKTAPMGAHVALETAAGALDVHLGNAKLLAASHVTLQAGDEVAVTGEELPYGNGTIFVARAIQKGTQTLLLRSKNGIPLSPTAQLVNGKYVAGGAR